jgi:predicted RNA-binding Zn ribbon-like protein
LLSRDRSKNAAGDRTTTPVSWPLGHGCEPRPRGSRHGRGARPSLDLVGTLKWRASQPEELLATPAAFSAGAMQAGLVDHHFEVDLDGFEQLLRLREAIYRLVLAYVLGQPWSDTGLDIVKEAATAPPVTVCLYADRVLRREGDLRAVASVLARDAFELLGGPEADRIRQCSRPDCTRLYVDNSRGGTRR